MCLDYMLKISSILDLIVIGGTGSHVKNQHASAFDIIITKSNEILVFNLIFAYASLLN